MTIQEWIAERRRIAERAGHGVYSTPSDDPELKFYADACNALPLALQALKRAVEGLEYILESSEPWQCASDALADIQKILEGA